MPGSNMNQAEQESLGSIQTRVHHLEQGLATLSRNVQDGFAKLAEQITTDRRPQWQAYGVMLTGVALLGALAYWPIREQQGRLEAILVKMDDQKIDVATYAVAAERGKESREQVNTALRDIQTNLVPRREHELQWAANAREMSDIQRQIDEVKKNQADTYSARDVLLELKTRQRELEDMVLRGRSPGS